ncbi:hypothetical protein U1Q18_016086 [Sarracenia purpurea var. burkii]
MGIVFSEIAASATLASLEKNLHRNHLSCAGNRLLLRLLQCPILRSAPPALKPNADQEACSDQPRKPSAGVAPVAARPLPCAMRQLLRRNLSNAGALSDVGHTLVACNFKSPLRRFLALRHRYSSSVPTPTESGLATSHRAPSLKSSLHALAAGIMEHPIDNQTSRKKPLCCTENHYAKFTDFRITVRITVRNLLAGEDPIHCARP